MFIYEQGSDAANEQGSSFAASMFSYKCFPVICFNDMSLAELDSDEDI